MGFFQLFIQLLIQYNMDNPFEITKKKYSNSPKRKYYPTSWTPKEQNEKLIGYLEIPSHLWSTIKCGSHIRYVTRDNEFRTGGFVMKNPVSIKDENGMKPSIETENMGMRLQNFFNRKSPDYTTWLISYNDTLKIYLKVDASIQIIVQSLENTIENININMKKITDHIKNMDDKIRRLENNKK